MDANVIKNLMDFIDAAEKSRKYPSNTASARRSAIRLFQQELNDQERASLDTLKQNIDQIFQNVFNKNKAEMTAESLQTYKNRFLGLIKDYEKYGVNPTKMANWNRPVRKVSARNDKQKMALSENTLTEKIDYKDVEMSRFELPLRPGIKAIILVPADITKSDVEKIRKYIDFLSSIASETAGDGEKQEN